MPTELSEMTFGKKLRILMKGKASTRKTSAAVTFPRPLLLIDVDQKYDSILLHVENKEGISVESIPPKNYTTFKNLTDELEDNYCPFATVVVDSLTSVARLIQNYCLQNTRSASGKRAAGGDMGVIKIPGPGDFLAESAALNSLIDWGFTIPAHFILIGHIIEYQERKLGEDEPRTYQRMITGGNKIGAEIPTRFSEVYHFHTEPGYENGVSFTKYMCTTQDDGSNFARTSLGLEPNIDFTSANFFEILKANIEAKGIKGVELG